MTVTASDCVGCGACCAVSGHEPGEAVLVVPLTEEDCMKWALLASRK